MRVDKQNMQVVNSNYSELVSLGIPTAILDNKTSWTFFLQEGCNPKIEWDYLKDMKEIQLIKLYWFMRRNEIGDQLCVEINTKFNLSDKSQFEIKEIENKGGIQLFDFFVDNEQLSTKLNVDVSHLTYSNCDLHRYSGINRAKTNEYMSDVCLGKSEPINQFRTNRIVLYRCHCGCDYCGMISFELAHSLENYKWKDIRYENDEDDGEWIDNEGDHVNSIEELQFHKTEYEFEWNKYLKFQ